MLLKFISNATEWVNKLKFWVYEATYEHGYLVHKHQKKLESMMAELVITVESSLPLRKQTTPKYAK